MAKREIIPISVLVEVTYKCNENCIHCCLEEHKSPGLSLEDYETLFDQMVDAGTFYVTLTGGDPFVRQDFMDIVRAARRRRLSTTIFTNGTLIDESIAQEISELYVQEVHISLYSSNSQTHDSITRLPGSFDKSVKAIKLLVDRGIFVKIKCPLMNVNIGDLEQLKRFAQQLGVGVQFNPVITAKNDGNTSTWNLRLSEEQLLTFVTDGSASGYGKSPIYHPEEMDCIPCEVVFNGGAVDPDGNVYVCNQLRIRLGNVLEQPLGVIWKKSDTAQKLRQIRCTDLHICKSCDLFNYCSRCPGLAHLEDGDLFGCSSIAKCLAQVRRQARVYPTQSHIFSNMN